MAGNPAPGYSKKPDHVVAIRPFDGRVAVTFGGETIADTQKALAVEESGYGAVYYLPRQDVRMDLAAKTEHGTHCPFKGDATYYSFAVGDHASENAAWSYEAPFDEASALEGYLAFYTNRVDTVSVD